MPDIAETVVTQLATQAGVPERIYPVVAEPQATYPFVVYHISGTEDANHAGGQSGLRGARFQFDSYSANSYLEARGISKAIRAALNGFNAIIENEMDFPTNPQAKGRSYRVMLQVVVWFRE
jgi:hypothetical protein